MNNLDGAIVYERYYRHPYLRVVREVAWKCIVLPVVFVVMAIPIACEAIYVYTRHSHGPGRRRHGCVRVRCSQRRYTDEEWRKLKFSPKPEYLNLHLPETQEEREERERQEERKKEDQIMGISSISEHCEAESTSDVTAPKLKPKGPFRFMDLPKEVQILVLQNLVVHDRERKWIARAGYCKYGFAPFHMALQHSKPVYMMDMLALWRAGTPRATRSLLLTSRQMCELTNAALTCSFSGLLQFHSRQRTSQLDAPWPWHSVTPQALVVQHNKWLFDHVKTLETPQIISAWPSVLSVMPSLERIKLTPRNVYGTAHLYEAFMSQSQVRLKVSQNFVALRRNVLEAGLEAGHRWVEWSKLRERDGQRTAAVSIMVNMSREDPRSSSIRWITVSDDLDCYLKKLLTPSDRMLK